ncbi:choice-of-anchor M domain-containing protein [Cutibacterium porci]|uniref:choice-of-anchor M domain-containing protein n=1 Tax=Cutibacterium porci TaxID=2605781 RepID=UPI002DD8F8F1|nr:choice-of-anchor M domain-containing protein [Cutibacterium porci]
MQAKNNVQRPVVLAVLMTIVMSMFAPVAWAADAKVVLSKGHTDAFYITTDGGVPVVKVDNGLGSRMYDPNNVEFQIRSSTYGKYTLTGVSESPLEGYYTGSEESDEWFEPGWNAPGFTKNGFDALRVDFTAITGSGKIYILGNSPEEDENGRLGAFLTGGTYQVVKGASLPIKGHQHAHWLFTRAGKYTMSGVVVGKKADGRDVTSQPFTLSWDVVKSDNDNRRDDVVGPSEGDDPSAEPSSEPAAVKIDDTNIDISQGHLDVFAGIARNEKLLMAIKDDRNGVAVYRAPEAVTLRVGENTYRKLPQNMHDRFAPQGYVLAQNGENQQEALFPGWDTYGVAPDFQAVDFEFVDVKGPGKVYMFMQGIGKLRSALTSGSWVLAAGESISQKKPGHVHTNWLFEKPGTYTMKVRLKGVPVKAPHGKAVASEPVTYTWVVGDRRGSYLSESAKSPNGAASSTSSVAESAGGRALPTSAATTPMPPQTGNGRAQGIARHHGLPRTGV